MRRTWLIVPDRGPLPLFLPTQLWRLAKGVGSFLFTARLSPRFSSSPNTHPRTSDLPVRSELFATFLSFRYLAASTNVNGHSPLSTTPSSSLPLWLFYSLPPFFYQDGVALVFGNSSDCAFLSSGQEQFSSFLSDYDFSPLFFLHWSWEF